MRQDEREMGPVAEWWFNTGNLFSQEVCMIERIELAQSLVNAVLADDEDTHDLITARLRARLLDASTALQAAADIANTLHDETSEQIRQHLNFSAGRNTR